MPQGIGARIYPTYSILERTVPSDWAALTAAQKEVYALVISAGTVNFAPGSNAKEILVGLFEVGSATRTALEEL